MYEQFGAVIDQDKVEFKLFFPDNTRDPMQYVRGGLPKIKEIRVRGDFQSHSGGQDWELATAPMMAKNPHPKGWLYTCKIDQALPEGFYQYKYFVTFENETTRWCGDPCTKYGGADEHENAGFAIGGHRTAVNPIPHRLPPRDLVLYELMIDDFTSEFRGGRAPIDAIKDRLDYLQELGINGSSSCLGPLGPEETSVGDTTPCSSLQWNIATSMIQRVRPINSSGSSGS